MEKIAQMWKRFYENQLIIYDFEFRESNHRDSYKKMINCSLIAIQMFNLLRFMIYLRHNDLNNLDKLIAGNVLSIAFSNSLVLMVASTYFLHNIANWFLLNLTGDPQRK